MEIKTKIGIIILVLGIVSVVGVSEIYCFNELKNIKEDNELLKSDLFSGNFTLTYYDNNTYKLVTIHSVELDSANYGNLSKLGEGGSITYHGDVNNRLNKALKFDILDLNKYLKFNTAISISDSEIENFKNIWKEKNINNVNNKDNVNVNIALPSENTAKSQKITSEQAQEIAIKHWEETVPVFKRTDYTYEVYELEDLSPCYKVRSWIKYPPDSPERQLLISKFGNGMYQLVNYDGSIRRG